MNFEKLDKYRIKDGYHATPPRTPYGAFLIPTKPGGPQIFVMASPFDGTEEWEHVSVSLAHRCPSWEEMCKVKSLFWKPSDCVVQFHPPEEDYVNNHPFCLHLWRWRGGGFPRPPSILVGIK